MRQKVGIERRTYKENNMFYVFWKGKIKEWRDTDKERKRPIERERERQIKKERDR